MRSLAVGASSIGPAQAVLTETGTAIAAAHEASQLGSVHRHDLNLVAGDALTGNLRAAPTTTPVANWPNPAAASPPPTLTTKPPTRAMRVLSPGSRHSPKATPSFSTPAASSAPTTPGLSSVSPPSQRERMPPPRRCACSALRSPAAKSTTAPGWSEQERPTWYPPQRGSSEPSRHRLETAAPPMPSRTSRGSSRFVSRRNSRERCSSPPSLPSALTAPTPPRSDSRSRSTGTPARRARRRRSAPPRTARAGRSPSRPRTPPRRCCARGSPRCS